MMTASAHLVPELGNPGHPQGQPWWLITWLFGGHCSGHWTCISQDSILQEQPSVACCRFLHTPLKSTHSVLPYDICGHLLSLLNEKLIPFFFFLNQWLDKELTSPLPETWKLTSLCFLVFDTKVTRRKTPSRCCILLAISSVSEE